MPNRVLCETAFKTKMISNDSRAIVTLQIYLIQELKYIGHGPREVFMDPEKSYCVLVLYTVTNKNKTEIC